MNIQQNSHLLPQPHKQVQFPLQSRDQWSEDLPQFCRKFEKHPYYGILIPPTHEVESFQIKQLTLMLKSLHSLSLSEWETIMANFPCLELKEQKDHTDMIILHDMLAMILNRYLWMFKTHSSQKVEQSSVFVHENLCKALFQASQILQIKTGMTYLAFNWKPTNETHLKDPQNLGIADVNPKYFLTDNPQQQAYFFNPSIAATFHLSSIINYCVKIQHMIEKYIIIGDISLCFESILRRLSKINEGITIMLHNLQPAYFYNVLRTNLMGYSNLLFTGVFRDGVQIRITTTAGAGGLDPSFQIFQNAFGIKFEGDLLTTQEVLMNEGMPFKQREAIIFWRQKQSESTINIRNHCSKDKTLKQLYNKVIIAYSEFMYTHTMVLQKFILSRAPPHLRNQMEGTGGTKIRKVQDRYKIIRSHILSQ